MIGWLKRRKINRLQLELAIYRAQLEFLNDISVPGAPGVRPGSLLQPMTRLHINIARTRTKLEQLGVDNP